jgi:hypothetical protein
VDCSFNQRFIVWKLNNTNVDWKNTATVLNCIEHCHCFSYFLRNVQLNIGKKYLRTAKIIDESLILAIVLRNYSTKPSYNFQLKRELKVWKYIFNLFHFEMLIQNRNPMFRPVCLFALTFHEYEARFVLGFRLDYKLSLFIFFLFLCQVVLCIIYVL